MFAPATLLDRSAATTGGAPVLVALMCGATCSSGVSCERREISGIEGELVEMFRP